MNGLRCALYARCSTEDQGRKYGLSSQLTELRALAKKRGYAVIGEFSDEVSGAKLERPKLDAMRYLIRERAVDVVLAHSSDRLSRDLTHLLLLTDEQRRHGVKLEYISYTPEGQFREQVLGAVAQLERMRIRERTARGRREMARKGKVPGGRTPFGYRRQDGFFVIEEPDAKIVRRIYTWLNEGSGVRQIARRLNAAGIPARRSSKWGMSSVASILKNSVYKGQTYFNSRLYPEGQPTAVYREKGEWIPITVPAIVSKPVWERAQTQLRRNSAFLVGTPGTLYLLKGLLVCACGRRMAGLLSHHKRKTRDYVYRQYRCNKRGETGECRAKAWLADRIETLVWDAVVGVLRDPEQLFQIVKKHQGKLNAERVDAAALLAQAEKDLSTAQKKRAKLLDLYLSDGIEKQVFETRDVALKKEEDRLTQERDHAKALVKRGHGRIDSSFRCAQPVSAHPEGTRSARQRQQASPPAEARGQGPRFRQGPSRLRKNTL